MNDITFASERDRLTFRLDHYRKQIRRARNGGTCADPKFWLTRACATIDEYRTYGRLHG